PDRGPERVGDPATDRAAVPAEVEDRREEEPQRDEPEPHQLVVLLALRPALLLLLDPCGQAWAKRALLLAARHGRCFAAGGRPPTRARPSGSDPLWCRPRRPSRSRSAPRTRGTRLASRHRGRRGASAAARSCPLSPRRRSE